MHKIPMSVTYPLGRWKLINCFTLFAFLVGTQQPVFAEQNWQTKISEGNDDLQLQKLVPAEQCFRKALKELEQTKHSDDDLVKCLEKLADCLTLEDKANESIPLYKRALHILEGRYGKDSPKTVHTLFSLGSIFESEGDPQLAMRFYQRALAINEKHFGPFSPAVANNLHRLGRATYSTGQPEQAEAHYKRSLSILMQQPDLASSKELESLLSDYSDLLRKKEGSDHALISDFQREVLKDQPPEIKRSTTQPTSAWQTEMSSQSESTYKSADNEEQNIMLRGFKQPMSSGTLTPTYKVTADVIHNQRPYKDAEQLYERMVAIDIKSLGPDHPSVADDLSALALLYISQQRYSDAEPLLVRALSIYTTVYGNDNMLAAKTRTALANVEIKLGKPDQARSYLSGFVNNSNLVLEPNSIQSARVLNELAFLYYREGKLNDACTVYKWALATTEAALGPDNRLVAACLKDYATVLRGLGQTLQAAEMQNRADTILATAQAKEL